MDRRSTFLGLRWVAILALTLHVVYNRGEPLWSDLKVWTVVMSLVLSNLVLTLVRPRAFQHHRLYFYTFVVDLLLVSVAVYLADAESISFFVMLLLCIFSGALSGNLKTSFLFASLASLIYLVQLRVGLPSFAELLDPSTLLRVPLLVVFALTAGSLSNRADRRQHERAALLLDLDRRLQTHRPPHEIAATLVELLVEKAGCRRAAFYLLNDGARSMRRIGDAELPATLHFDQLPPAVHDRLLASLAVYPEHLARVARWSQVLGIRSGATFIVPASYSSRTQGVLIAEYPRRILDGQQRGELLGQLADRAASALMHSHLIQTAQESAIGLHSLLKMSEAVSASLRMPEILSLLEECCCRLMKVRRARVFLVAPATDDTMTGGAVRNSTGTGAAIGGALPVPDGTGPIAGDANLRLVPVGGEASALELAAAREAWHRGQPVELGSGEEIAGLADFAAAEEVGNLVAMPLTTAAGVLGVLEAVDKPEPFTPRDLALLGGLAGQAAVALEKARLYEGARDRADRIEGLARGLDAEKRKLEHVLASMEEGVVLLEPSGVTLINHAGRRLLAPNRPLCLPADRATFDDPLGLLDRLFEVLQGQAPRHEIIPDGDRFLLLQAVRLGSSPTATAAPGAAIAVTRDITEIVRLGEKRTEFVSQVSHELRTPLSAIIGAVKLLGEGRAGTLSPTQTRLVGIMETESGHLLQLINDLLDLAKLDAGSMGIEKQDIDLSELIDDALGAMQSLAADKSIVLCATTAEATGLVPCDPLRVRQVLLNLLGNAIKFTGAGGRVQVEATRDGEQYAIRVTDTGPGIPPEKLEAIFDKFEQLGSAASRAGGTGLGLAISRRIVEGHDGVIWVTSELGAGSTFHFTLPAGEAHEIPATAA